jgi:phospholipid/cholesterol/gamma-HCH transport system substrate-binding protein
MTGLALRTQIAVSAAVVALLALALLIFPGDGQRTVTAHFDRAVAVYPGTDLRVMGVQIGKVTSVVPDGSSVRVEMTYDPEYKLPADAKAAVVTPTLVADRYVQVFPAYGKGAVLPDDADIPLERTQTPIELDRMYKALDDLSVTLGPKAGSTSGALDNLLTAGAKALEGNGELGSKTIRNLSEAADTFARNRGPLFDNVRSLAEITDTLAANDTTVQSFLEKLTSVSGQLEGEREELRTMLAALARVLGTVKGFVHENREVLGNDVKLLSSLLDRMDKEKDALGIAVQEGSLALGNLAVAFESGTGTYGSRVQVQPGIQFRPDQFLCQTLTNSLDAPEAVETQLCTTLTTLFTPLLPATSDASSAKAPEPTATPTTPAPTLPELPDTRNGLPDLFDLLGGDRQ